jgi:hypothetical protein
MFLLVNIAAVIAEGIAAEIAKSLNIYLVFNF